MDKSQEISAKTARVVDMLRANRLGGALISSQPNFSWLTAGGTNGVDLSREPGAGALLVRNDGKRFVLANCIEMPRLLNEELGREDFEPVEFPWEAEKALPTLLAARALTLLNKNAALGSDVDVGSEALPIDTGLARCRYQLTTSEIERYHSIGSDAARAIGRLASDLAPGETEREIARRCADVLAAHDIRAVVTLVAADERIRRYRHPVPTDRRWEKIVMLVVCGRRGGMTVSLTRIVCKGAMPDELRRRTIAAARVNATLLAATRPGATGAELYEVAARAYAAVGFEGEQLLHHQGGACGYRTRDWVAHPASADTVHPQQAFAWNPSITGTKIEETCIVADDGVELLTSRSDWPQIPFTIDGRDYFSPDILSL